jgi:hypothetical protein
MAVVLGSNAVKNAILEARAQCRGLQTAKKGI